MLNSATTSKIAQQRCLEMLNDHFLFELASVIFIFPLFTFFKIVWTEFHLLQHISGEYRVRTLMVLIAMFLRTVLS
jgi:hypothetical protein